MRGAGTQEADGLVPAPEITAIRSVALSEKGEQKRSRAPVMS